MKSIDVKRGDRFIAREMMRIVYLLDKSHLKAAESVFLAFQRFLAFATPKSAGFLLNHPGGDWDDFSDESRLTAAVRRRLISGSEQSNCSLIVVSDDSNISDFSFSYSGYNLDDSDFRSWASCIVVTMPVEVFEVRRADFQNFFMNLLNELPAFSGYASRSLEGDQIVIQKIAKRYPGLDISSVSSVAKDIDRKAPGSFWLNAFKGDLAHALGDLRAFHDMPPNIRIAEIGARELLVLCSADPERLTVGSAAPIDGYRWLAQKLRAADRFHVPRRVIYFEDEDDIEDVDAQVAWHSRLL